MNYKIFIAVLVLVITTMSPVFSNEVLVDRTFYNIGVVEPGKGGWDYTPGHYFELGITCNIDVVTPVWRLKISAGDFNNGDFKADEVLKMKVFYIGHQLPDPPYWEGMPGELQASDHLTEEFSGEDFVAYTGGEMYIAGSESRTGGPDFTFGNMKVVLAITVFLPEDTIDVAGDYINTIQVELE